MNLSGLCDSEIWALFKAGDKLALAHIYRETSLKLYRYGLKFTPDGTLVEDTIQDMFADLIRNHKNLGDTDNILYYLLKAFRRKLIRKQHNGSRVLPERDIESKVFEVTWSVEHELILHEISRQRGEMLLKALNNLTNRQKEAIYLRYTKELGYKAIAGIMEISVEACRNLISGAVKNLKNSIRGDVNNPLVLLTAVLRSSVIRF
jgi:RNA polymerase sigma factor (sigma-70 family)